VVVHRWLGSRDAKSESGNHRCICGRSAERIDDLNAVGRCIGNSTHLKHLALHLPHIFASANVDAMSFCRHKAINNSIESLLMFIFDRGDDENEAFRILLTLFQGNSSIQEVKLLGRIPATAIEVIARAFQSSQALKKVRLPIRGIECFEILRYTIGR
jgi:hypothetical protein